ncbi:hypothetical protein GGI16_003520, partial [Coemansia sp. S142-1]
MNTAGQNYSFECGAFCLRADQTATVEVDQKLLEELRPERVDLRAQAAVSAKEGATAVSTLIRRRHALVAAKLAQLQRTRWRANKASNSANMPMLSEAESMFADGDWCSDAVPGIVCAGIGVASSTLSSGRPVKINCSNAVDNFMSFELGNGGDIILGVAAYTSSDVEMPVTSGILDVVIAAINRHANRQINVRHAWVLILGPGRVRVCKVEHNAIRFSAVQFTADSVGIHLLGAALAFVALAEDWKLGSDPTMRWCENIRCWEIDCPDPDDKDRVVYAPREPVFMSDSFFGRYTLCFAVALGPFDTEYKYMVKDSWQQVPADLEDDELLDEIGILRGLRDVLDTDKCKSGLFQCLVHGGTVQVNNTCDSTSTAPTHRLHRRMLSGPVGISLYDVRNEQVVAAAVADAMLSHAMILKYTGIIHCDVSPGNILAAKQADGTFRGVLIDMDNAVPLSGQQNIKTTGLVGTYPFMGIANMEGLDVPRTAVDDCESALVVLMYWAAPPLRRNALGERLSFTGPNGAAEFRRQMFASSEELDKVIATYIDTTCVFTIWLIRALYDALFAYPECKGTGLGNQAFDPIIQRVYFADILHQRFLAVMARFLYHYRSGTLVRLLLPVPPDIGGLRASQNRANWPQ